jgi:ABC-type lipoprotein export system ATPase subunit
MTLNLKEITKTYQSGENTTRRTILDQLDLQVNAGDRIAIVGPSGSGKTT